MFKYGSLTWSRITFCKLVKKYYLYSKQYANSGNMHAMKQRNSFTSWLFDIRVIHHYAGYIQIYFVCPI